MAADIDEILARRRRWCRLSDPEPAEDDQLADTFDGHHLHEVLRDWEHDDDVHAVVLTGAGERGLCAGGDIVAIYHSARADGVEARRFWRDEYLLNAHIGGYPKPYVALMDGIVMGGGVGVGAHASIRVVTDSSKIAMPEVGIGFVPDVGGTYLLSRAPGLLGLHAGLTGAPFSGPMRSRWVSPTTTFRTKRWPTSPRQSPSTASTPPWTATPPRHRPASLSRNGLGSTNTMPPTTVADIVAALRAYPGVPSNDAGDLIDSRSPMALAVTLEAVRRAAKLDNLEDVLPQDLCG